MSAIGDGLRVFRGHRALHLRIIDHWRWWFLLSGTILVLSLGGLILRGLNYSIAFEGGAVIEYVSEEPVTPAEVQSLLDEQGVAGATVQIIEGDSVRIRVPELNADSQATVLDALARQAGVVQDEITISNVSPTWGTQISRKALQALIVFLVLVSIYIAFRFEWKMALSAIIAMIHDLTITAGVYALTGREVTPETVIAILTIMGFSLYDTVVIFDKIGENSANLGEIARTGYSGMVNRSLNQVFMRSVNTSITVLMPLLALLFFGGETLKDFAFALFVGVLVGAYSSPFVAAPLVALLKEREPKYRQLRERRTARSTKPIRAAAVGSRTSASLEPAAVSPTPSAPRPASAGTRKPAARKKPKRRRR